MLEVSALMVDSGRSGGEDNAPPGRFCCRGFLAPDICPNRYNNSQKTHSKFTNCKELRDYFPLNIQCILKVPIYYMNDEMSSLSHYCR